MRLFKSSVVSILLVNFIKVIKEDEIGNKCSMHWRYDYAHKVLVRKAEKRNDFKI